jgi:hypothetical protein
MNRYRIKDLLWLTLVVAVTAAWYADRTHLTARSRVLSSEIAEIKESRDKMRRSYKKLIDQMQRTPLGRKLAEARETVKDD